MEDIQDDLQYTMLRQKRETGFNIEAIQEHLSVSKTDSKKFRVHARNLFLTYPRCTLKKEKAVEKLKKKRKSKLNYVTVAHEHHEDGTDHLHALLSYDTKQDITIQNAFDLSDDENSQKIFHPNIQSVRNSEAVHRYVQKHGDFVEDGSFVTNLSKDSVKKFIIAQSNAAILSKPINELVRDGSLRIQHVPTIIKAVNAIKMMEHPVKEFFPRIGLWVIGGPGIGKSFWSRLTFGSLIFNKPQNKWWDSYKQERIVLIDDFDKNGSCLSHHLKVWADNYGFNAEVKGDNIQPQFNLIIVTSNYTPGQIFTVAGNDKEPDPVLSDAIKRRFLLCTISGDKLIAYEDGHPFDEVYRDIKECDEINWKELLIKRKESNKKKVDIDLIKQNEEDAKDFFKNVLDKD